MVTIMGYFSLQGVPGMKNPKPSKTRVIENRPYTMTEAKVAVAEWFAHRHGPAAVAREQQQRARRSQRLAARHET